MSALDGIIFFVRKTVVIQDDSKRLFYSQSVRLPHDCCFWNRMIQFLSFSLSLLREDVTSVRIQKIKSHLSRNECRMVRRWLDV